MQILFVYIDSHASSGFSTGLGIASLSGFLRKHGLETGLVYYRGPEDTSYLMDKLRFCKPDAVGFYSTSSGYNAVSELSGLIKSESDAVLFYGGIHAISFPELLFRTPVDAICYGCGEIPMLEYFLNPSKRNIPGLYFRESTPPGTDFVPYFPPGDMHDELLDFDYDIFLAELKRFPQFRKEDYRLEIIFNRGCPFSCRFCSNHVLNKIYEGKYISPSPGASIETLRRALKNTGFKRVEIHDDTFTLNKKWFRHFIKRYIDEIALPFQCNLRAGCFDDEDAELLKKANIETAWLGLESGNENIRMNIMNKTVSDKQLADALRILEKHKINVTTQNMIGVPGETPDMFLDTVRFNARYNPGSALLSIYYPYPGTQLYKTCLENGYLKESIHARERTGPVLELPDFPKEKIQFYFDNFRSLIEYEKQRKGSLFMPELTDANVEKVLRMYKNKTVWPVDIGALKSTRPVSYSYGLDRGMSIDRYYIEKFLKAHAGDIKNRCLEMLDASYTKNYGGDNVTASDVLDIDASNTSATVVSDLQNAGCIKDNTYDCFICTQTLHLISDFGACISEIYRILNDGGVLLATVPCLSRCDIAAGGENDLWRMTPAGAKYAFGKVFGEENIEIFIYGNVKTGMAFWEGLAQEDLDEKDFDYVDVDFPVLVGIRAVKGKYRKTEQKVKRITKTEPNCTVLLYHRVNELENDPDMLCVTPENFKKHLSFFSRKYEILTPAEFGKCLEQKSWPAQESILITFDDGYADNFNQAAPILQQYGTGAFFFASSGYIGSEYEFWWDELQKYIYNGRRELVISAGYLMPDFRAELASMEQKEECYVQLVNMMKGVNSEKINDLLNYLSDWSGLHRTAREANRIMTVRILKSLDLIPNMEIGAHTISHTRLSMMNVFQQYTEIGKDAENLSRILDRRIRTLSYPFGTRTEQTEVTYNISALAGYDFAFINDGNKLSEAALCRMELSRFIIRNWTIPELRSNLDSVFATHLKKERSDYNIAIINEKLVKFTLSNLFETGIKKVVVFGVGQHTIWLLALMKVLKLPEPVALLDDNAPSEPNKILGIKYCKPNKISPADFECIIISSDCYFAKLAKSIRVVFPDKKLINLYEGLQPISYPKRKVEHILNMEL